MYTGKVCICIYMISNLKSLKYIFCIEIKMYTSVLALL